MRDRRHRNNKEGFTSNISGKPSTSVTPVTSGPSNSSYPPKMRCYDQQLDFNCSSYGYNSNDKNMSVCKNQQNENIAYLPDSDHVPTYVLGRSAGRPRQCKKLL
jgi:hypothetical protein